MGCLKPWIISGQPGQKVKLFYYDFGRNSGVGKCVVQVKEKGGLMQTVKCVRDPMQRRLDLYKSQGHQLGVTMLDEPSGGAMLIEYRSKSTNRTFVLVLVSSRD